MKTIVFIPIAEREVPFYIETAKELSQDPNLNVLFASLYQPGNERIESAGFPCFDIYHYLDQVKEPQKDFDKIAKRFGIKNLHKMILHEKLTFGLKNDAGLYKKFCHYLEASNEILQNIKDKFPSSQFLIVQELGGFIGPLSFYYSAKAANFTNCFIEPSFFKGRLHFNLNTLEHLSITNQYLNVAPSEEIEKILAIITKEKTVIAPKKDRHHYLDMGLKKIFNKKNFEKIYFKLKYKYIDKKKQEYEHIFNHVKRYFKMLFARYLNSSLYTKNLPTNCKILYFPLHVQLDFSLTVRSHEYLDQIGLLEKISNILPVGWKLVTKEHPASIGCLDRYKLKNLLQNKNVSLMHPSTNSYDILDMASAAVTINSKVGAEALATGLPVFVFGKTFYSEIDLVNKVNNMLELEQKLLRPELTKPSKDQISSFFTYLWQNCKEGELYDLSAKNISLFTKGIKEIMDSSDTQTSIPEQKNNPEALQYR